MNAHAFMHAHTHARKYTHTHTSAHRHIQTKGRNQRDDEREKKRQEGKRREYHSQHCVPYFVKTDGRCQATQHEWQIVGVHIWQWYHLFRSYYLPHTQNGVNQFQHPACFSCMNGTEPFNIRSQWSLQHHITMILSLLWYSDSLQHHVTLIHSTPCYIQHNGTHRPLRSNTSSLQPLSQKTSTESQNTPFTGCLQPVSDPSPCLPLSAFKHTSMHVCTASAPLCFLPHITDILSSICYNTASPTLSFFKAICAHIQMSHTELLL